MSIVHFPGSKIYGVVSGTFAAFMVGIGHHCASPWQQKGQNQVDKSPSESWDLDNRPDMRLQTTGVEIYYISNLFPGFGVDPHRHRSGVRELEVNETTAPLREHSPPPSRIKVTSLALLSIYPPGPSDDDASPPRPTRRR